MFEQAPIAFAPDIWVLPQYADSAELAPLIEHIAAQAPGIGKRFAQIRIVLLFITCQCGESRCQNEQKSQSDPVEQVQFI